MTDPREALDRITAADDLIRTIDVDGDPRINPLITKAQRMLYEISNRIQNVIDVGEE